MSGLGGRFSLQFGRSSLSQLLLVVLQWHKKKSGLTGGGVEVITKNRGTQV